MAKKLQETESAITLTIIPYEYIQSDGKKKTRIAKNGRCTITAPIDGSPTNVNNDYKVGAKREEYEEWLGGKQTYENYLDKFKLTLTDTPKKLDLSKPYDKLIYNTIRFHPYIADGEDQAGHKPECRYVIINESTKARNRLNKSQKKIKAFNVYGQLTPNQKRDMLYMYALDGSKQSDEMCDYRLLEMIELDPARFVDLYDKTTREDEIFVYKLIHSKVLNRTKGKYQYGDNFIGSTVEEVVAVLDRPENGLLKEEMMKMFLSK